MLPPRLRRTLATSLLLLGLAAPAAAQTDAQRKTIETLERWGLMGAWSLDCSRPPSSSNGYLAYSVQDGVAVHIRDFGDAQDENEVQQASVRADGGLEVVVHFEGFDQTRRYVMVKADGRVRAWANSLADGTGASIKDGKFVADGSETPWQTQCPMEAVPESGQAAGEPATPR
ncbi:MAG: hypothetical protein NW223_07695 [Hyphomicrobiaceae bacterium]|nr:hypothetical protein [Hyphomicrobiaceae bacterium]